MLHCLVSIKPLQINVLKQTLFAEHLYFNEIKQTYVTDQNIFLKGYFNCSN